MAGLQKYSKSRQNVGRLFGCPDVVKLTECPERYAAKIVPEKAAMFCRAKKENGLSLPTGHSMFRPAQGWCYPAGTYFSSARTL
jgi:hypothetical protein